MPITGYPGWVDRLNAGETLKGTIDAYGAVPMLYRAVNLRADSLGTVPYHLMRGNEEVEWPWARDLGGLMRDTERSLLLSGAAYWLRLRKGNVLTGFQVLNPTSVRTHFNYAASSPYDLLQGMTFTQMIDGRVFGPFTIDDIVYFREPSMHDDVGPGLPPARVALQSAQQAHYVQRFISHFFEGGAQPITVLNLPADMDDAEFKRYQADWLSRFTGVLNSWRTAFVRASDFKVTKITPEINTLMMPELIDRAITLISMTLGVPRTMIEASAANYATADSDRQSFWRETIVPRLALYSDVINHQLLEPLQYRLEFHPDELDVMQADEAARAGSLLQLVQAGIPLPGAMKILGYDNIEDVLASSAPAETGAPTDAGDQAPIMDEQSLSSPSVEADAGFDMAGASMTARDAAWGQLSKKVERRIKRGRDPRCSFVSDHITQDEVKAVMDRMYAGISVAEAVGRIDAIKAADTDLSEDERRLYDRLRIFFSTGKMKGFAQNIYEKNLTDSTIITQKPIADILTLSLNETMTRRIDRLSEKMGEPMPSDAGKDRINDFLADYVPMRTKLIDETTAAHIRMVVDEYRLNPGMTLQDIQARMEPITGAFRARMIAITETTRAASQATSTYQSYLGERGIRTTRVWNTVDVLACDICDPLNGKDESVWGIEYPDGAPAHVNCRCDIELIFGAPAEEQTAAQEEMTAEAPQTSQDAPNTVSAQDSTPAVPEAPVVPEMPAKPVENTTVAKPASAPASAPDPIAPKVPDMPASAPASAPIASGASAFDLTKIGADLRQTAATIDGIVAESRASVAGESLFGGKPAAYTAAATTRIAGVLTTLTDDQQNRLYGATTDAHVAWAAGTYGNPDLRIRAAGDMDRWSKQKIRSGNGQIEIIDKRAYATYRAVSVDYYIAMNPRATAVDIGLRMLGSHVNGFDRASAPWGAMISDVWSRTGPNAGSDAAVSYWPKGITPPRPHPRAVAGAQALYDDSQQRFARAGITSVTLYRGTSLKEGQPIEPWSTDQAVADIFARKERSAGKTAVVRKETIPVKYALASYDIRPDTYESYIEESEYSILATGFYAKGKKSIDALKVEPVDTEAGSDEGELYGSGFIGWDLYEGQYL